MVYFSKNAKADEAAAKLERDELVERARLDAEFEAATLVATQPMTGGSEEAPFFVTDSKYDGSRFNVPKVQVAIRALNDQIAALKPDVATSIPREKALQHVNVLEGIVADLVDAIR